MKIYKCVYGDSSDKLERNTQKEIKVLFDKYPNGKIEVFNSFGCTDYVRLYNSIVFETEPKEEKFEINPLIINQIIDSLKDLTNN